MSNLEGGLSVSPRVFREVDEVCAAFEEAWKRGGRPKVEDFVSIDADPTVRAVLLKELILLDSEYRKRAGEEPASADYASRLPEDAALIESVFSGMTRSIRSHLASMSAAGPAKPASSVEPLAAHAGSETKHGSVSLEEFVKSLTECGLMTAEEVKALLDSFEPPRRPKDGKELAEALYRHKKLTKFQAQAVYQGKTRGLVVGNYFILDRLGRGGMGQVYKARHRMMDRVVALKRLPSRAVNSEEAVKRFHREVRAAAKLSHPNIVTAYDASQSEGVHFLVLECVDGQDLASYVKEHKPMSPRQAVQCILQAARGLEYAHQQGVIHRDIKPHNLLMDKSGTVKILDMGLARIEETVGAADAGPDEGLTQTGQVMGTLDYMSPEQALDTRTADARSDIYSLGCTLYYLLAGRSPYRGDTATKKILAHRNDPIPSLRAERSGVSETMEEIYRRMLAKDPGQRQQTMSDVIAQLEACLAGGQLPGERHGSAETVCLRGKALSDTTTGSSGLLGSLDSLVDMPVDSSIPPPIPLPARSARRSERRRWWMIGVASAVVGAIALLVVVRLSTKAGTLVVEISEPDAVVQVLNESGTVEVSSKSQGDKVSLSVHPGRHQLKVEKAGFEFYSQEFTMESRGRVVLAARLEKSVATGTLSVQFEPKSAVLEVVAEDGKVVATFRNESGKVTAPLPAGDYRLHVECPAFQPHGQDFRVVAGATANLVVKLPPLPPSTPPVVAGASPKPSPSPAAPPEKTAPAGTLSVQFEPNSAVLEVVAEDGKVVATVRNAAGKVSAPLPAGDYRLHVENPAFQPQRRDFRVVAGATTDLVVRLDPVPAATPPVAADVSPKPSSVRATRKKNSSVVKRPVASPEQRGKTTFGRLKLADLPPEVQARIDKETEQRKKALPQSRGQTEIGVTFGRVTFGDGSPVRGPGDVAVNLYANGDSPLWVLPGGWFYGVEFSRARTGKLVVRAFDYYPMDVPLASTGGPTGCEIEMERVKDADMGQVQAKVVDEGGRPLPDTVVTFTPSIGASHGVGTYPEKEGKTDAEGLCVFSAPPGAECDCFVARPRYIYGRGRGTVGPGEAIELELKLFRSRNFVATLDYVFQTNGSRDLASPECQRGTLTLSSSFEGGAPRNTVKFTVPSDPRHAMDHFHDLQFSQQADKATFSSHYSGGRGNGFFDAGPVELDSIKEAPESGYSMDSKECQRGHVYLVRTQEGRYVKFLVKSIEEGPLAPDVPSPDRGPKKVPKVRLPAQ